MYPIRPVLGQEYAAGSRVRTFLLRVRVHHSDAADRRAGKALNVRGTLRGKTVPDGADLGLSPLACASVLPGQGLYLGYGNRSARHGKEKVYGPIGNEAQVQETSTKATDIEARRAEL